MFWRGDGILFVWHQRQLLSDQVMSQARWTHGNLSCVNDASCMQSRTYFWIASAATPMSQGGPCARRTRSFRYHKNDVLAWDVVVCSFHRLEVLWNRRIFIVKTMYRAEPFVCMYIVGGSTRMSGARQARRTRSIFIIKTMYRAELYLFLNYIGSSTGVIEGTMWMTEFVGHLSLERCTGVSRLFYVIFIDWSNRMFREVWWNRLLFYRENDVS
jgi:hypothetical protein